MTVVAIPTEESAFLLLQRILDDEIDAGSLKIDFSSAKWTTFRLKVVGEHYHSSLNADLMRALVEYQATLYRVAAYARSGRLLGSALDEMSRDKLRLNFKVVEGSSEIAADGINAITELVNKVTEGMGPKAKWTLALVIVLSFFGGTPAHDAIDGHFQAKKEQIEAGTHKVDAQNSADIRKAEIAAQEREHTEEIQVLNHAISALEAANVTLADKDRIKILNNASAQVPQVNEVRKQSKQATNGILKQIKDADHVTIQGYEVPGETLKVLDTSKRRSGHDIRIKKLFYIEAASAGPDGFMCKIRDGQGGVLQATLPDAIMSEKDQGIIQKALWDRTPVTLVIKARKVGVDYRNAEIESAEPYEVTAEK